MDIMSIIEQETQPLKSKRYRMKTPTRNGTTNSRSPFKSPISKIKKDRAKDIFPRGQKNVQKEYMHQKMSSNNNSRSRLLHKNELDLDLTPRYNKHHVRPSYKKQAASHLKTNNQSSILTPKLSKKMSIKNSYLKTSNCKRGTLDISSRAKSKKDQEKSYYLRNVDGSSKIRKKKSGSREKKVTMSPFLAKDNNIMCNTMKEQGQRTSKHSRQVKRGIFSTLDFEGSFSKIKRKADKNKSRDRFEASIITDRMEKPPKRTIKSNSKLSQRQESSNLRSQKENSRHHKIPRQVRKKKTKAQIYSLDFKGDSSLVKKMYR